MKRASKFLIGKHDLTLLDHLIVKRKLLWGYRRYNFSKNDCIEIRVKGRSFMHNQVRITLGLWLKLEKTKLMN